MWKRAISLILTVLLICTILPLSAYAANDPNSLTIDLTDYPEDISGTEDIDSVVTDFTITAGSKKTFSYDYAKITRIIKLTPSAEKPVQKWDINGTEYSYADSGKDWYYIDLTNKFSVKITQTYIELSLGKKASGENWTIKPIGTQTGFKATAEVADETQGSAIAAEIATNEFELKATANPGYSFDYWLVKSDSSKITENPKTVTLTADETYTAYFREWKQATVSSELEGLTSGSDTDLATAARKWDDTWTLTAKSGVRLDDKEYVFTYWSCDQDPSFKSERRQFDVTLTENRSYVAHYLPPQITGITGISAGGSSDWATTEKGSRPLITGTSVKIAVQYTDNGNIPHSWIKLYAGSEAEVKAGTATLLTQREGEDSERDSAFDESGNAKRHADHGVCADG